VASNLQPAVEALVERRLVEDRIRGTPAAEVEGAAVLEATALSLWSNPRTVYLLWHLASNKLRSTISLELEAIASLREAVLAANRPAYAIRDLRQLEQARLSLLQIEGQGNLSTGGGTFQSFTKAIDTFLNKSLAPSVRVRGGTDLFMSGLEAVTAIPGLYESLVVAHTDVTERISALSVCIPNFLQSDVGTYSGVTTAVRARLVLEQVMSALETNPTPEDARELTLTLLSMKASLKAMGTRPDPTNRVSASSKVPAGRVLRIRSEDVRTTVTLFEPLLLNGGGAELIVDGHTWSMPSFPLAGYALANKACIVTDPISFPVTIPLGSTLLLAVGGVTTPVPIASGSTTLAALVGQLNVLGIHAEELYPGSNRIAIVSTSNSPSTLGVETTYVSPGGVVTQSTVHTLLGLSSRPQAASGTTDPTLVRDVLLWMTSSAVEVLLEDGALKIQDPAYSPTSTITYVINSYSGTVTGVTDTVWLEESGDAVLPAPLIDVGDYFVRSGTKYVVQVVGDYLTVSPSLSGLDASAEIYSGLVQEITDLEANLSASAQVFALVGWLAGLQSVDAAVASVLGQPSVGTINRCVGELDALSASLVVLQTSISTTLVSSATAERAVAARTLTALRERGFDRAHDFLLRGSVREIFSMDWQTASYAGDEGIASISVDEG
jgi:hypothetical protein